VHLDYEASAGCPDRAAFIAEIAARTTRARFVDEGDNVRIFKASIRSQGERIVGSLISNTGQAGAERRVSGKTCSEVVSALGLITALAIDPSASTRPSPSSSPEAAASSNQSAQAAVAANSIPEPAASPVSGIVKNEIQTSSTWGVSWGVQGEASYGATLEGADLTMLGGSLHVESGPFAGERRGALFRIGGFLLQSPTETKPTFGEASITRVGAEVACSPLYIRISNAFEMHPWVHAEIGRIKGSGASRPGDLVTNPGDQSYPWLAVGESMEARWLLGKGFWLGLDLRATQPLIRETFVFTYRWQGTLIRTPITAVPYLEGIVGLGIGGRIL